MQPRRASAYLVVALCLHCAALPLSRATTAPYVAAARPTRRGNANAGDHVFSEEWIRSKGGVPLLGASAFAEALTLCRANHSHQLSPPLQLQLINKLADVVLRLVTDAAKGSIDSSKASRTVSRAFQSRELLACVLRRYHNTGPIDREAGHVSIALLVHAAEDAKLVTAMLEGGLAAGQAYHLLSSFFNRYVLNTINFVVSLVREPADVGADAAAKLAADRTTAAAAAAALAPISYDDYSLIVTYDSLHDHSPTFRDFLHRLPVYAAAQVASEETCVPKSILDAIFADVLRARVHAVFSAGALSPTLLRERVTCGYNSCDQRQGNTIFHQLASQGAHEAFAQLFSYFADQPQTPALQRLLAQALLTRGYYANRTPLEVGAVLHGEGSRIVSVVAACMREVLIPESTLEKLLARARDDVTQSLAAGAASLDAVGGVADKNDHVDANDWMQDGVCATPEFSQGITHGDSIVEYHGMPDPATLKRLTSSGQPVVLRAAGASLGTAPGMWSRADLLARFGNHSIPVGHGTALEEGFVRVSDYVQQFSQHGQLSPAELGYSFAAVKGLPEPRFRSALQADFRPFQHFLDGADPFRSLPTQGSGYFFYLGAPCSGGKSHYHGVAVNLLVHGLKRWSVFPPDDPGSRYCMSPGPDYIRAQARGEKPHGASFLQRAGDIVVLPSHWAHATANIAATVGVAKVFEICDTCFS